MIDSSANVFYVHIQSFIHTHDVKMEDPERGVIAVTQPLPTRCHR